MYVIIVYDISSNEARAKLANYLKTRGFDRIQRSAFIGKPLPGVLRDVERILPKYVEAESDVIHLIPLLEYSLEHMKVFGKPFSEITGDRRLLVIR